MDTRLPYSSYRLEARHTSFNPYLPLVVMWALAAVATNLPIADSPTVKALILASPAALSTFVLLASPAVGLAVWSVALGILVSQTGYQFNLGILRFSALELAIVALMPVLLWFERRQIIPGLQLRIVGQRFFIAFFFFALAMLLVSLNSGTPINRAFLQFKGFLIYPCMAFVLVAGLREPSLLRWSAILVVGWYLVVAGQGMLQYSAAETLPNAAEPVRVSGDYAPINTYGITLGAISIFLVGLASVPQGPNRQPARLILLILALWLFGGAVFSVSRTVWLAYGLSLLFLALSRRKELLTPLLIIGAALLIFQMLPEPIAGRILQLSDTSTVKREYYLTSGLAAWGARPLFGWGWGQAFYQHPVLGLVSTGAAPWYHNDYLNLLVQVGLIGLALYLGFWLRSLAGAFTWLKAHGSSPLAGYVRGGQAALLFLLIAAGFEHVLWRSDIAGLVGWLAGLMCAAMAIAERQAAGQVSV